MSAVPDFHALRATVAEYPDAMVHDCAAEVWRRLTVDAGVTASDLLWLIESYERSRPRIWRVTINDSCDVTEAFV